jgi:hypothetical protein
MTRGSLYVLSRLGALRALPARRGRARGEKTKRWPSLPMRSRQSKPRIYPQSFDNSRDEFPHSTGAERTRRRTTDLFACASRSGRGTLI